MLSTPPAFILSQDQTLRFNLFSVFAPVVLLNNFKVIYRFAFSLIFRLSGFSLCNFSIAWLFFLLFSFQGSFFFSLPSVVFYLAGLLVYITISFLLCQHLFLTFYRLFLLSFLLSVLMLPLLPRWCVQFIISSSLCQFFSSSILSFSFSFFLLLFK